MLEMSTPKSHMYIIYYITLYICIIYIYICYHENNVPSRLSPQWLTHALALCVSWITYDHWPLICIYMANWLLSFFLHILKCKVFWQASLLIVSLFAKQKDYLVIPYCVSEQRIKTAFNESLLKFSWKNCDQ